MTIKSAHKRALLSAAGLTIILFLNGCSETNKIEPKPKDKDISAEERKAKRGGE